MTVYHKQRKEYIYIYTIYAAKFTLPLFEGNDLKVVHTIFPLLIIKI